MSQKSTLFSLSGATLKYIALITMTLDHIAAVLLPYGTFFYTLLRGIGRIAFPIYCFLLAEGYLHTSDRKAYCKRLLLFALLSEIPFDMALFHFPQLTSPSVLFSHQNIFFTLTFAFISMHVLDDYWFQNREIGFLCLAVLGILAELFHFDYGLSGILVVIIFFICKKSRPDINPLFMAVLAVLPLFSPYSITGICVLLSIPFLLLYNGKKGSLLPKGIYFPGVKYLFYIYYPAHLFIIGLIYFL